VPSGKGTPLRGTNTPLFAANDRDLEFGAVRQLHHKALAIRHDHGLPERPDARPVPPIPVLDSLDVERQELVKQPLKLAFRPLLDLRHFSPPTF